MMKQSRIDTFFKVQRVSRNIKTKETDVYVTYNNKTNIQEELYSSSISDDSIVRMNRDRSPELYAIRKRRQSLSSSESKPSKKSSTWILRTPTKLSPRKLENLVKISSTSPSKSPKYKQSLSPRKLFSERIDMDLVQQAVENFNLAKQGAIKSNNFNLEEIYLKGLDKEFKMEYGTLNLNAAVMYDVTDLKYPSEKHAAHVFAIITEVFSRGVNCGYFNEEELDITFSILTLSHKAQMLLARMLKRKRTWYRISDIKYNEIDMDLIPVFQELIKHNMGTSDIQSQDNEILLKLLKVKEVDSICKKSKVPHGQRKEISIQNLLQQVQGSRIYFFGAKSPKNALRNMICRELGPCFHISEKVASTFDRIATLFFPSQDPQKDLGDMFLTLTQVHEGKILYPTPTREMKFFPIFGNREHLISYVESKANYHDLLKAIENKKWDIVRDLGRLSYNRLISLPEKQEDLESSIPLHVKKFAPEYFWVKTISKSVDAFKKSKNIEDVITYLNVLINQKHVQLSNKASLYQELCLLEKHYKKDLESSATFVMDALVQNNITELDTTNWLKRAETLLRRQTGISKETKANLKAAVERVKNVLPSNPNVTKIIGSTLMKGNISGSKSTWIMNLADESSLYMSVEGVAMQHYFSEGFSKGSHCEGSLPVLLFAVLCWEELYEYSAPCAFLSSYQEAPLDLYTKHFYDIRSSLFEKKFKSIRGQDFMSFVETLVVKYIKYCDYESIMNKNLFKSGEEFKEVVICLGLDGILGICEKLAKDYNTWKSGFPDLIVWNYEKRQCKIVEVKGPGDDLSSKQKLWLWYLESLGIPTELCIVRDTSNDGKRRQ
ncbi:fanconi-associated nuclease 1 [Cephus cinctus]|uniref:Fanconi-associated nuclease n=1 Tax=Cephus cinctus TaxID=211228 RepID=A0AAJ7FEU7_CEPCN|nr:fanconi-associated nuclease 1 [Cephus cinctus]